MNAYTNTRSLRQCASLAQASEYNLFILTNAEQRNSEIEGRAAVGGNALFSCVNIGSKLCNKSIPCPLYGTDPTLVVGGNLTWDDGSNFSGNTIMSPNGSYKVTDITYKNADSTLQPIRRAKLDEDFENAFSYYRSAARQWNNFTSLPNTTTVINCMGNIYMIGLNQDINIFKINYAQVAPSGNVVGSCDNSFDSITSLTIIAPENSTILINVNGANIDFGNYSITRNTVVPATLPEPTINICKQLNQGITPSEAQKKLIFWNFYNADTIVTSNVCFQGTVFAPYATVYTLGGSIEGSVIADGFLSYGSVANHTELHNYLFSGCLPVVKYVHCIPTTSCTSSSSTTTGCTTSHSTTTTKCTSSSSSTTSCPTSSSTTTHCPTSSSTTTHCPTSSSTTTHCPTSSSTTTHCPPSSSTTTHCPTSSSTTTHYPTTSSTTTHCPTSSSTTTHCPTTSSTTTHCPTTSSTTTHCPTSSSTTTHCPTSSSTTTHCPTTSSTTTSCPTSSYTTSSSTTWSHTTWSHTTWSHTTWSHTTWSFTTPNTSSTTTICPPRNIKYCPRCKRRTSTWKFNGRLHHYCFYCGYHYIQ